VEKLAWQREKKAPEKVNIASLLGPHMNYPPTPSVGFRVYASCLCRPCMNYPPTPSVEFQTFCAKPVV
jgi:hypothetical protein